MTRIRTRLFLFLTVALTTSFSTRPAQASLILSFDSPSYSIANIGGSTSVGFYVSQVPGTSSTITPTNPLLTGGIQFSFITNGAAVETGFTAGPAWDNSSSGSSISGSNIVVSLTVLSLRGISDLSKPLLLGTFTFTGRSLGSTSVLLSTIHPGVNFIDLNGDDLDPTNTPTALIRVGNAVSVPEPKSLALLAVAGVCNLVWLRPRRRRPR